MTTRSTLLHHPLRLVSLAALAAMAFQPVQAQDGLRPYVGASIGRSEASFGSANQVGAALPAGTSLSSFDYERRGTGFKLFGGYQFDRYLALEAGYFDLGKPGFKGTTTPVGQVQGRYQVQGVNMDLVGTLPVSNELSVLGRVGVQAARTRADFSSTGGLALADVTHRHTNAKYGVGVQYALAPSMLVRAELERYRVNDAMGSHVNQNLWSVGLVFPIGAPAASPRAMAPTSYTQPMQAAAPMAAPAPAPAPVVVVQAAPAPAPMAAPVAPQRRRVTFSAESLFGFDRAVVNAEGKAALDKFAVELNGTQFDQVVVQGHTDRLGTEAYNMTLSRQRADAVKNYLVTGGKVDPMKVTSEGKGETTAVTKPEDCVGKQASAKLISCLAADRRVDVEVVGTR